MLIARALPAHHRCDPRCSRRRPCTARQHRHRQRSRRMLEINLAPAAGNASGRSFPHTGYLALSTVQLAGTFHARRPPLSDPLLVKSISVRLRCYEYRTAGVFAHAAENILFETEQMLFRPRDGNAYQQLETDTFESAFKLEVPVRSDAKRLPSSATFKEWKVVWKLEALVDYKPIPYLGSRIFKSFLVNLCNHQPPAHTPSTPPLEMVQYQTQLHFQVPSGSFGPGDTFDLAVRTKAVGTDGVVVKKVVFWLERRLHVLDDRSREPPKANRDLSPASSGSGRGTTPDRQPSPPLSDPPRPSRIHSLFHRTPSQSSPPSPPAALAGPSKAVTQKIAEAVVDNSIIQQGDVILSTATLTVPKKGGKWDTGESIRSGLVSVEFNVYARVSIKLTKGRASAGSSKDIILPSVPVIITAVSAAERAAARAAILSTVPASASNKRRASSRASSFSSTGKRNLYIHDSSIDVSSPERRTKTRSPPASPGGPTRPRTSAGKLERSHPTATSSILRPTAATSPPTVPKPSISFAFPSPPPSRGSRTLSVPPPANVLPPISSFLPTPPDSFTSPTLDYDSLSLMRQFANTGRRISTTTSEEDELEPSRSRQRLELSTYSRPSLPSLGALGLGLPQLSEIDSRPSSASGVLTLSPTLGSMSDYTLAGRPHTASASDSFRLHAQETSFAFAPPPAPSL